MVRVLICSSEEIYNNISYEGRAEADLIAYSLDEYHYKVVKCRHFNNWIYEFQLKNPIYKIAVRRWVEKVEYEEWKRDKVSFELQERYKTHPLIELCKNG